MQSCKKLCWYSCFMTYCRIELHVEILENLSELLKFGWNLVDYMKYWIYSIVLNTCDHFENFKLGNNIPNLVHNRSIVKSMANSMQGKNCRIH